jgi:hypothetical protein
MTWDTSQIQIEQRVPRCMRCGKMVNLRGHHFELAGPDGSRALACSEICCRELSSTDSRWQAITPIGGAA